MSGAVPDAPLAWTQGETTGTCNAVNAKGLKAELQKADRAANRLPLLGPCQAYVRARGTAACRGVLQRELVAAGWGWIIYGLRLPSVGVVGPCAVWGHAEKKKGRACLFN